MTRVVGDATKSVIGVCGGVNKQPHDVRIYEYRHAVHLEAYYADKEGGGAGRRQVLILPGDVGSRLEGLRLY